MSEKPTENGTADAGGPGGRLRARQRRQAAALRENLGKRKLQARARSQPDADTSPKTRPSLKERP